MQFTYRLSAKSMMENVIDGEPGIAPADAHYIINSLGDRASPCVAQLRPTHHITDMLCRGSAGSRVRKVI
jgi:hypothetical protein